jgi:hypothetical protein
MVYTMAQPVSYRALIMEGLVQPQVSPCGMCDVQNDNGAVFSLSTEDFPQCHSTNAPYSFIHVPKVLYNLSN